MSAYPVTSLYAGLCGLLLLALSMLAIRARLRSGTPFGFGEDRRLLRAIRAQGNFAEYAPLSLILLFMLEAGGQATGLLHILGGMVLGGRVLHAFGISREPDRLILRQMGMVLTFLSLALGSALVIVGAL
ncbi:MAPEG family protein [Roseococcus sp. YIM B11640]|uniref:MAPEG family protein n=1 Tax=Roseococcus sp. YIM B11640 TaxID=3133973 RepID=UPI003C7CEA39